MNSSQDPESGDWQDLVDRHLFGELNDAEVGRLAELLDSDQKLRKSFVERAVSDTELAEVLRGDFDRAAAPDTYSVGKLKTRHRRSILYSMSRHERSVAAFEVAHSVVLLR